MELEFWGVEVKPGQSVKCEPGEQRLLHLSQVAIGESEDKGSEDVIVFVEINDQKLVIGHLSMEKWPQLSCDLPFEKDFELSHTCKKASVYFSGYRADQILDETDSERSSDSDSEDEHLQIALNANGIAPNANAGHREVRKEKGKSGGPVKSVTMAETKLDEDDETDDDSESSDDDEDMIEGAADSDEEDDSEDEGEDDSDDDADDEISEEDATPEKSANGKKRAAESASKTPVPEKKAKLVTPAGQKTGKKNAHAATPHPAKEAAGKTTANSDKTKQSPKSAGSVNCNSCSKSFNSDNALQAHTKAKHNENK